MAGRFGTNDSRPALFNFLLQRRDGRRSLPGNSACYWKGSICAKANEGNATACQRQRRFRKINRLMSRRSVLENFPRPLPNPPWKLRKAQRRVPLCIFLIYRCAKELVVLFEALHVTRRLQDPLEQIQKRRCVGSLLT